MQPILSQWQVWALGSALFAALTAILAKVGVERIDPTFATLIRTVVILLLVAGAAIATDALQPLSSLTARSYGFLIASGAATGLSWLCYFRALKLGPVAQVASLDKLSVVMVAVFAAIFLGDALSPKHWIGVALVAAGAVVLASRA